MANIRPIQSTLDDFLNGFFIRPMHMAEQPDMQLKLDVREDDKAYTVHAEIPGVKKDDIHVNIEGNLVSISAEVKNEKEVKEGEKLLRSERYFGKVSRSFKLAQDVDDSKAAARYNDGVLELVLPKRTNGGSKRLNID